ncbi:MAG: hypothetical protein FWD34_00600 [Oscillospiraceae bacterium]|nr:hypothetical protein [Oscillospiraceae bacterium]
MGTCTKCGAQIAEGQTLCAACASAAPVNESDITHLFDAAEIEANKTNAILCYLLWYIGTIIVMCGSSKESKLAKFYANYGLILGLAYVILFWTGVVPIVVTVFMILGIVDAVNGRVKKLPLIGNLKIIKWDE